MPRRRLLSWVAGLYLLTRALTLATYAVAARIEHRSFIFVIDRWDGAYYRDLAYYGYPRDLPVTAHGGVGSSQAAFYPVFPWLTRWLIGYGMQFWLAGLLLVTVAGTLAAVLIAVLVRRYASSSVALLTALCWAVFPLAGVLSVDYAEALLTLFIVGCLLALLDRRWLLAGILALLAGATRPTGSILVLACVAAVIPAIAHRREWRSLTAAVLAPLGTIGSVAWIGWRAGRLDAWFVTEQNGWHATTDGGRSTYYWIKGQLLLGAFQPAALAEVLLTLAMGAALVAVVLWQRPPLPVLVYAAAGFALVVGTGNVQYSSARFLLPLFPLLVPVARLLDRLDRRLVAGILVVALAGSAWIGSYYFTVSAISP